MEQLEDQDRFSVRQRYTAMVNRYEIRALRGDGSLGEMLALAQQKRMAFKEQVTFYADEGRTTPLFGFKARQRLDIGAMHDVTDAAGRPIGWFRKDFAASLLRSTWHLGQAGTPDAVGRERNMAIAIVRRVWDFLPFVDMIPFAWPYHFDFTAAGDHRVMSVERRLGLRDHYTVTIHDPALDRRVAAAMAVALDALQSR
jgi:uncharacterized protein YxjI